MIKNTLLYALVVVGIGCGGNNTATVDMKPLACTQIAWQSGMFYAGTLHPTAPTLTAVITACRNSTCATSELKGATLPTQMGGVIDLAFSLDNVSGAISYNGTSYGLGITYAGMPDQLADGDVYSIKVVAADGTQLLFADQAVQYSTTQPNGPGCGFCKQANL